MKLLDAPPKVKKGKSVMITTRPTAAAKEEATTVLNLNRGVANQGKWGGGGGNRFMHSRSCVTTKGGGGGLMSGTVNSTKRLTAAAKEEATTALNIDEAVLFSGQGGGVRDSA